MKALFLVLVVLMLAPAAWAGTFCYGWEDGMTILGQYPATGLVSNNTTALFHTGARSLELVRTSSSTTQAYVAWIKGLTTGDVVTGVVYIYDTTAGGNPSGRIWAHYGSSTDVTLAYGSASGPADYSGVPLGWGPVPNTGVATWTFGTPAPTNPAADALIIEVRSYGNTSPNNVIWVDDITITAPTRPGVSVVFPGAGGPSAVEPSTWGGIKALYR